MQTVMQGSEELDVPVDKLRTFLSDTSNLSRCIPDSSCFSKIDDSNFKVEIDAGISVVHDRFKVDGRLEINGNAYTYELSGRGLGSSVKIRIMMELYDKGGRTLIDWKTEAMLSGIVSGVSEPIIKDVINKKVIQIIERMKIEMGIGPHGKTV